jgi:hypothetical protein
MSMEVKGEGDKYPSSLMEAMENSVDEGDEKIAALIGLLLEKLHAKGVFTDADVMSFLHKRYRIYKQPD